MNFRSFSKVLAVFSKQTFQTTGIKVLPFAITIVRLIWGDLLSELHFVSVSLHYLLQIILIYLFNNILPVSSEGSVVL